MSFTFHTQPLTWTFSVPPDTSIKMPEPDHTNIVVGAWSVAWQNCGPDMDKAVDEWHKVLANSGYKFIGTWSQGDGVGVLNLGTDWCLRPLGKDEKLPGLCKCALTLLMRAGCQCGGK